jgi:hypothetical protein
VTPKHLESPDPAAWDPKVAWEARQRGGGGLPFQWPPEPLGNRHRTETGTSLGDRVEQALCDQLGFASLLPHRRQGALDVKRGMLACEVKAVTREATEYKVKCSKAQADRKRKAAQAMGLIAATCLVVVDGDRGWVYLRAGVGAFRLSRDWLYCGRIAL